MPNLTRFFLQRNGTYFLNNPRIFPRRTEIVENYIHEEIQGTLSSGNALLSVSSENVTHTKFNIAEYQLTYTIFSPFV